VKRFTSSEYECHISKNGVGTWVTRCFARADMGAILVRRVQFRAQKQVSEIMEALPKRKPVPLYLLRTAKERGGPRSKNAKKKRLRHP